MKALLILVLLCFYSCSSGMRLTHAKANRAVPSAELQKIFVLSLTPDQTRSKFENRLRKSLKTKNIQVLSAGALTNPDFYDSSLWENWKTAFLVTE